jgi:hypothetical protein
MASRKEPDDSLDYFPTPPWATRALVERVLPVLGIHFGVRGQPDVSIWEPACGDGHMAEVLREYERDVSASDVHEYGYGEVDDFLELNRRAAWIITNPPFGHKATAFIRHALGLATEGVAMFLQLRYLEGIDRYNLVFRDRPPTLFAPFVERVPLHRGRLEPRGSTATAYCWVVWVKGMAPRPPFWIPPGQRKLCSRPDDAKRFTTSPVIRKASLSQIGPQLSK